jgi:glutathione S-transferase
MSAPCIAARTMTTTAEPILYSFRRCPFAMRAQLALAISGTACELREVVLRAKPAEMLAASPKGTVPVLLLPDGTVVDQSLDIMRWALRRADPEGWLSREDAELIATADGSFKHDLDRYKYPHRHGSEPLTHRAGGVAFLQDLEARLTSNRHLGGEHRGFTDAAIMPFVRQFAAVEPEWFDALPLPCLHAWLRGHVTSDLFAKIMTRFAPWSPGDPPTLVFAD